MVIDLQNLESCRKVCKNIDIVIHLAANADFDDSLLGNNIISTHNMFRVAKEAGCKQFIFASSAHVVSAYEEGVEINSDMMVKPGNKYGATKCFGEA